VFAQTNIDHVIMGGGIPLETRLEMVRVIFESSETTSVHMKDVASGGFPPFVRSVLSGLLGATTFIDKIVKYATVTIPTGLEIRAEPTSKSARIGTYPPGLVLSFVEVVNGENVGGNPLWGRIKQGQYVWLGGTDRPNG
jgi:hypothetical protein